MVLEMSLLIASVGNKTTQLLQRHDAPRAINITFVPRWEPFHIPLVRLFLT
jgi:hypothetical protein